MRRPGKRLRIVLVIGGILTIAAIVTWSSRVSPRAILRGHGSPVNVIEFSPDGRTLASGGCDMAVRLWDPSTGRQRAVLMGHPDFIKSLAFSPDGSTLATSDEQSLREQRDDGVVILWDVITGTRRATLTESSRPPWAAAKPFLSPDGTISATLTDHWPYHTVTLRDAARAKLIRKLSVYPDQVNTLAFSPDGRLIVTGGGSTDAPWPIAPAGAVRIWDVKTGRLLARLSRHWGATTSVAFSPDGRTLATASKDGTIHLWDVARILGR